MRQHPAPCMRVLSSMAHCKGPSQIYVALKKAIVSTLADAALPSRLMCHTVRRVIYHRIHASYRGLIVDQWYDADGRQCRNNRLYTVVHSTAGARHFVRPPRNELQQTALFSDCHICPSTHALSISIAADTFSLRWTAVVTRPNKLLLSSVDRSDLNQRSIVQVEPTR